MIERFNDGSITIEGVEFDKDFLRECMNRIFWKGSPTLTTGPQCEEEAVRAVFMLEGIAGSVQHYKEREQEWLQQ